jgi:predicted permease
MRPLLSRIHATLFGRRRERELEDEIQDHLAMLAEDFERHGLSPSEARLAARRSFGAIAHVQEEYREVRRLLVFDRVWADVRFAFRMMRRNPGFTLVAVLTLALGIGVNTTLFSAYNAVVLKPLPVADPDSVYRVERWFQSRTRGNIQYAFSYPEYEYLRDRNRSFSGVVAASWPVAAFPEGSGKVQVQLVSPNYFDALGVRPRLGRGFVADEEPALVLSHSYWARLGGDAAVLGRTLKLNGTQFTVVGVTAKEFTGTSQSAGVPDCWAPLSMQMRIAPGKDWLRNIDRLNLQILGRVRPGVAAGAAQAESSLLLSQIGSTHQERDKTIRATLQHVAFLDNTDDPRFQMLTAGVMLLVGTVLLVACANLANMMLARGAARQQEIGMRLALGAGRGRLIRQLLTESMVLGLIGGAAGLAIANWSARLLWGWMEQSMLSHVWGAGFHLAVDPSPDVRVLGYTVVLCLATGLIFGLSPALRFTRGGLASTIRDDRNVCGGRLRFVMVAGQVAVSMMLLITAGLLGRGLLRARVAEPGFETARVFHLDANFGVDPVKANARQRRLLDRIRGLPEVRQVGEGHRPLSGTWTPPIVVGDASGRTLASYASDTYFDALGIGVLRGRGFTRQEVARNAAVAVISESAARQFWPRGDAIGRRFQLDMDFRGTMAEFEVIGIVKDVRFASLSRPDPAHVYLTPKVSEMQRALIRVQGDPRRGAAAIRAAVQQGDPDLIPGLRLTNLEEGPVWLQKAQAQVLASGVGILAALALVLAGAGIYGVLAYLVSRRTREIGIRMALGANSVGVLRVVLADGLRPVVAGMLLGAVLAGGISGVLHATLRFPASEDFLYGVSSYDPWTFGGLIVFVVLVTAAASLIPARRAIRVDPMIALRCE